MKITTKQKIEIVKVDDIKKETIQQNPKIVAGSYISAPCKSCGDKKK